MFAICVPSDPSAPDSFVGAPTTTETETGYEIQMAPACDPGYAQRFTISTMASLFRLAADSDGQIRVVRTADELVTCLRQGILAVVLHFEGAEAIDPVLDALCPSARNLTDEQLDAIGESGGVVGVNFCVSDLRADGRRDADTPLTEIVRHVDYILETEQDPDEKKRLALLSEILTTVPLTGRAHCELDTYLLKKLGRG